MKKLSMNEINVISNVIRERINESKYEKIKGKLEKDVEYKKLEKLEKEGILTSNYTFYNKKREPLTESQLCSMNFKCFKKLYLEFELRTKLALISLIILSFLFFI